MCRFNKLTLFVKRKAAFTLAEVLITLGIIGVVAALTIPTLIGKYQKLVWVAQLQKSYNTASNSLKQTMAIDEVTEFTDTEFYKWFNFNNYVNHIIQYEKSEQILKKYFKIVKFMRPRDPEYYNTSPIMYFSLSDDSYLDFFGQQYYIGKFTFADGSEIHISFRMTHQLIDDGMLGYLWIDVNGHSKGPNRWGRDFFIFEITKKGQVMPVDGQGWGCDEGRAYGIECSAKIIKDGWKMKY